MNVLNALQNLIRILLLSIVFENRLEFWVVKLIKTKAFANNVIRIVILLEDLVNNLKTLKKSQIVLNTNLINPVKLVKSSFSLKVLKNAQLRFQQVVKNINQVKNVQFAS